MSKIDIHTRKHARMLTGEVRRKLHEYHMWSCMQNSRCLMKTSSAGS